LISTSAIVAEPWPNHLIRFIFGFSPGGVNDLVARAVAEGVSLWN